MPSHLSENVSPNSEEKQFAYEITRGEPSIVIKPSNHSGVQLRNYM